MDERAIIQRNCKRFREEVKLSQDKIAIACGVSVDSVRGWEQGKRSPDRDNLRAFAKVLNRDQEDFYALNPPAAKGPPDSFVLVALYEENTPSILERLEKAVRQGNDEERALRAQLQKLSPRQKQKGSSGKRVALAEAKTAEDQQDEKRGRPKLLKQDSPATKDPKGK